MYVTYITQYLIRYSIAPVPAFLKLKRAKKCYCPVWFSLIERSRNKCYTEVKACHTT